MIEIPLLLLYVGNVTQQHGASAVWAQTRQLGSGLLYGAAWAVLLASIGLLLASANRQARLRHLRRRHPALLYLHPGQRARRTSARVPSDRRRSVSHRALASLAGLISPFTLLGGVLHWLQGSAATAGQFHAE